MTYGKRQPYRWDILPQAIRLQLRLDVPKQRRHVLLLGDPLPLRRALVLLEVCGLLLGVGVCPGELDRAPECLGLEDGGEELWSWILSL